MESNVSEKIKNIYKPLAISTTREKNKKKRKLIKVRNKRGDISSKFTELNRLYKGIYYMNNSMPTN